MKVVRCNQPTYFDCDDTLVMWGKSGHPKAIPFEAPASRHTKVIEDMMGEPVDEEIEVPGWTEYLVPNVQHIEALKQHKARGHTIVVWSAGGWEWAEVVVKTLGLEKYVDIVLEKPMWYYDDLKSSEFMPESSRVYKKFED